MTGDGDDDGRLATIMAFVMVVLAVTLATCAPDRAEPVSHDITTPTTTEPVVFQP